MRYCLVFILLLATLLVQADDIRAIIPLRVDVKCRDNPSCVFNNANLPIDIVIANDNDFDIDLPLAFIKQKGPYIRITDALTKKSVYLNTGIPGSPTAKTLTRISPGGKVSFTWIIFLGELMEFHNRPIDLSAEIIITKEQRNSAGGGSFTFHGKDTIRISERSVNDLTDDETNNEHGATSQQTRDLKELQPSK